MARVGTQDETSCHPVTASSSSNSEGGYDNSTKSRAESILEEHKCHANRRNFSTVSKGCSHLSPPKSHYTGERIRTRQALSLLHFTEEETEAQARESRTTELRNRSETGTQASTPVSVLLEGPQPQPDRAGQSM